MSTLETLIASYGFAFGPWQGSSKTDAALNRFAAGLSSDAEAKALINYLYDNREKHGYHTKPTGKDMEAGLVFMRRDRGELPAAGGCPECDGCGVVLVAAHRVADKWVIGWHPEARLVTCPCTCPRGRELWRKDSFEGQYLAAREWLDGQRGEAQAAHVGLITWLTRQENALAAARRRAIEGDGLARRGSAGVENKHPTIANSPGLPSGCKTATAVLWEPGGESGRQPSPEVIAESEEIPVDIPAESGTVEGRDADRLTAAEAKAMMQSELCDDADGPDPAFLPF